MNDHVVAKLQAEVGVPHGEFVVSVRQQRAVDHHSNGQNAPRWLKFKPPILPRSRPSTFSVNDRSGISAAFAFVCMAPCIQRERGEAPGRAGPAAREPSKDALTSEERAVCQRVPGMLASESR